MTRTEKIIKEGTAGKSLELVKVAHLQSRNFTKYQKVKRGREEEKQICACAYREN